MEQLRAKLASSGMRVTQQRLQLSELVFGNGDRHVTAEQLHEEAAHHFPRPSLATVYNVLRDFAAHGLVREVATYGTRTWFDTRTGPHSHFHFQESNELVDIPEDIVPRLNIPPLPGTSVISVDIIVTLRRKPATEPSSPLDG